MNVRQSLRRYHIWLGWIIGIPILLWTASGLLMVIRPIEEVRGTHLLKDLPPLELNAPPVPPAVGPRPVKTVSLEQRTDGPKWIIRYMDGGSRLADPATGNLLPSISAADAVKAVKAQYTGTSRITAVDRISADNPPLELRTNVESWRVAMDDGTHFYVDSAHGGITASRTAFWRLYDFMWGLHIMDLKTREDTNNPLVIGFGAVALISSVMALILLPLTIRRKRKKTKPQAG